MTVSPPPLGGEPQVEGNRRDPTAPEPEFLFEVVDGVIVRKTVGAEEIRLAHILYDFLSPAVRASEAGACFIEMGFSLSARGPGRKPDLSVLSYRRWPRNRRIPPGDFLPAVPELAVEVVSPHETLRSARRKVGDYFRAGAEAVWLVLPDVAEIHIYSSPTAVRIVTRPDVLTGDPVVPGFRIALADLFPPAEDDPPAAG